VLLVVETVLRVHHGSCQLEVKVAIGRNLLKQWAQMRNNSFELVNKKTNSAAPTFDQAEFNPHRGMSSI